MYSIHVLTLIHGHVHDINEVLTDSKWSAWILLYWCYCLVVFMLLTNLGYGFHLQLNIACMGCISIGRLQKAKQEGVDGRNQQLKM